MVKHVSKHISKPRFFAGEDRGKIHGIKKPKIDMVKWDNRWENSWSKPKIYGQTLEIVEVNIWDNQ